MKPTLCRPAKNHSFFARMLLLCSSLLLLFSVFSGVLIGSLSSEYEKSQFLRTYDLAMAGLSEAFSGHVESFPSLSGKLLENNGCKESLCTLLEAPSYEEVSADTRSQVVTLLSSLCSDNPNVKGALLYSLETQNLYYYSNTQLYLNAAEDYGGFSGLEPYTQAGLSAGEISGAIAACSGSDAPTDSFYGFSATLFRTARQPLGYFIPLYSASELQSVLDDYQLSDSNCFWIESLDGSVCFQSSPLPGKAEQKSYTNSLLDTRYGFRVSYSVSHAAFPVGSPTKLIILLAVFVTLFSFLLYYLTYYFSNKNIGRILNGMKNFSLKNLSYRIEAPDKKNEFSQIIDGFNRMCGELQKNVERSYIYELQQKKSELYALQTSINPHFLYNTLDMIRAQIGSQDTESASRMLLLLARVYRAQTGTDMFIPIADEAELCESFLLLYQGRFRNFDYEFDIDDSVQHYALPKNTLQPMIENYFVHGIAAERQDNLLALSVYPEERPDGIYIHMLLENNGNPISEERISELNEMFRNGIFKRRGKGSFALTNVYNRLKIAFSDRFSFDVRRTDTEMCFQIEAVFPARTPEQLQADFTAKGGKENEPGSYH